ncbi:MAG: hypothetical protein EZS28_029328 [Streblomastix strix]|uniref:Uncharacterized protein n=1 Tax=Streblomastix strix TaxID=222440 RepID=A0A5J4UWQ8_9EUKA|nr:MAG: hypothetical protein EZS28_029328 [Streblomastix strix]
MEKSNNENIRNKAEDIICNVVKPRLDGLKEGQQHQYHNQLQLDGTITKLVQLFKDEEDEYIHFEIALTISYLFKALPLPPEIKNNVIQKLKQNHIYELSLLSECPENHDAILANDFEKKLFQDDEYTLDFCLLSSRRLSNSLSICAFLNSRIDDPHYMHTKHDRQSSHSLGCLSLDSMYVLRISSSICSYAQSVSSCMDYVV